MSQFEIIHHTFSWDENFCNALHYSHIVPIVSQCVQINTIHLNVLSGANKTRDK